MALSVAPKQQKNKLKNYWKDSFKTRKKSFWCKGHFSYANLVYSDKVVTEYLKIIDKKVKLAHVKGLD